MKKILLTVLAMIVLSACSTEVIPTVMPEATVDIDATVEARVAEELEITISKTPISITKITPTQTPEPTPTSAPSEIKGDSFTYSLEKITGSLNHSPDGTWWGYNQSKIVRYGDTVFTYVIQNDNDPATESLMTLYKKVGEGPWEQGASMPCSRPGNILIDSKGGLHALVFDPGDILANNSLGSLEYYYFSQAGNGDVDTLIHTTVIPSPGDNGNETVNIRIGASIGLDDTIALAFGLGTTEQFYYKKKSATEWYHFIAGENLGHNFYYPYPLVTDDGYAILAIQDDYVEIDGQAHNPYHIAAYFQGNEHGWSHEYLLDNTQSSQALTHSQWQTVDISDLYLDTAGDIHVVLQDRVAEKWLHYRKASADSDWTITTIDTGSWKGINWMRLIEIEGNLYYFMNSWNQVRLMNSNTKKMVKLDLESLAGKRQVEGMYSYIASPRTGTSAASEFVDILLLNGDAGAYPNGPNYYLKIAKDYFLQELPPTPTPDQVPTTATPAPTPTATLVPAAVFKPSLEKSYEVSVEEAVVYGTGGTLDGGQVELLLDLAIPDTGTDGPRPLFVHIHGGGFQTGSRWTQWDVAERGWVAASIDYRLAGDEPLPGPRVKPFFDAVGGKSSSARNRSVVASVEDTLVALDYLFSRADELNIDTDRIVLKGESAGAFIALNVAYCADKFEISGPTIAAVIDFAGGISEIFCGGGTAIDPGEAAVFIAHGTADAKVSFTDRALSIVDGATAAGITYELYPLEGVGHIWLLGMLEQTIADGRKIDDLMYEFLNHVLYGE
jgi:predicted esterase